MFTLPFQRVAASMDLAAVHVTNAVCEETRPYKFNLNLIKNDNRSLLVCVHFNSFGLLCFASDVPSVRVYSYLAQKLVNSRFRSPQKSLCSPHNYLPCLSLNSHGSLFHSRLNRKLPERWGTFSRTVCVSCACVFHVHPLGLCCSVQSISHDMVTIF